MATNAAALRSPGDTLQSLGRSATAPSLARMPARSLRGTEPAGGGVRRGTAVKRNEPRGAAGRLSRSDLCARGACRGRRCDAS
jgi:hypothetical protein